jgi:hypothetical protein
MTADCVICQPSAFFSSIAYLVSAFLIVRTFRRWDLAMKSWVYALMFVTLASMVAHATAITVSYAFDMAAITTLVFSLHLARSGIMGKLKGPLLTLSLTLGVSFLIYWYLPLWLWAGILITCFFVSAGILWMTSEKSFLTERLFLGGGIIYAVSYTFYQFDGHPYICQISWLPYAHTIWHIGSAATSYVFAYWYFGRDKRTQGPLTEKAVNSELKATIKALED